MTVARTVLSKGFQRFVFPILGVFLFLPNVFAGSQGKVPEFFNHQSGTVFLGQVDFSGDSKVYFCLIQDLRNKEGMPFRSVKFYRQDGKSYDPVGSFKEVDGFFSVLPLGDHIIINWETGSAYMARAFALGGDGKVKMVFEHGSLSVPEEIGDHLILSDEPKMFYQDGSWEPGKATIYKWSGSTYVSVKTCKWAERPKSIPRGVSKILESSFAGWRIQRFEDLSADDQKLWMESRPGECPGIALGKFMDEADQSFALLLVPEKLGKVGFKVVVFADAKKKGEYTPFIVEDVKDASSNGQVIYRVPPSHYSNENTGIDEPVRNVSINLDGIQLEKIEAGTIVYFWKNHRFEKVVTSD